MYSDKLKDFCENTTSNGISKSKKPEVLKMKDELIEQTSFLDLLPKVFMTNRLYCVKNEIYSLPLCKACGENCGFFAADNNKGFNVYCSQDCRSHSSDLSDEVNLKLQSYDWMFEQRITKRMSHRSIGELLGISERPVIRWCDILKIPKTQYNASDNAVSVFLDNKEWLEQKHKTENLKCREIADIIGSSAATVSLSIKNHGIEANNINAYDRKFIKQSVAELELLEFIKTIYSGEVISGSRSLLGDGREIDIFIPELKIGFEYNGVWHHSYNPSGTSYSLRKDKTYHKSKTDICEEMGIDLIQIWSSSWLTKKEIWKSRILAKFGIINKKIYARKCVVKEISIGEKNTFLDNNHLQGRDKSNSKLGLFFDDELISVMTFGKSRYNKNIDWELIRFATKLDTLVVGGFSKLLSYFRKYNSGSIVSYADRMHSKGDVYQKNGFVNFKINPANYHYFKDNETLLHRQNFQKAKISEDGDTRSESQIMTDNGYKWVYDCGTITYILK